MAATFPLKPYRVSQLEGGRRQGYEGIFNSSCIPDIVEALQTWDCKRVLFVFSKSLHANNTIVKEVEDKLGSLVVCKKEGVGAHSPYHDVIDIGNKLHEYNADCIVSLGSGSYSDACKVARLMHSTLAPGFNARDMEDLIDESIGIAPPDRLKPPTVKLIVVPTSLSAGEWNDAGSCSNAQGKKQHFMYKDSGAPSLVLMDPKVASTAPVQLWMSSGIRAVDHCIETLCNRKCDEYPDAQNWCREALRALVKGLVEYKEGRDGGHRDELLDGISKCQEGSRMALMGLLIYRIPMGASHAIGHQIGSVAGVMHGVTSCIMLPQVLRFTKEKNPEAQAKVVEDFNSALGWHEIEAGDCVEKLVRILGLPSRLSEVGVMDAATRDLIVDKAMTDVWGLGGRQMEREEIAQVVNDAR